MVKTKGDQISASVYFPTTFDGMSTKCNKVTLSQLVKFHTQPADTLYSVAGSSTSENCADRKMLESLWNCMLPFLAIMSIRVHNWSH